jgi:hypothetical protein
MSWMKRVHEAKKMKVIPKDYQIVLKLLAADPLPKNAVVKWSAIHIFVDLVEFPKEEGNYLIIDALTNRQRLVTVWVGPKNHLLFAEAGINVTRRVEYDNKPTYRWLKLRPVSKQQILDLPASA